MAVPKSVGRWGGAACGSVKVRCLAARRAQGLLQSYFFFFFVFFFSFFFFFGPCLFLKNLSSCWKSLLRKGQYPRKITPEQSRDGRVKPAK